MSGDGRGADDEGDGEEGADDKLLLVPDPDSEKKAHEVSAPSDVRRW